MHFWTGRDILLFQRDIETPLTQLTEDDKKRCLRTLYPGQEAKIMNPKKKYVCAVCKSVCDLFGLFIHMKQVRKSKSYGVSCTEFF